MNCDRNQIIPNNNFLTFTPYLCDPERLDDLPIEDDHHNEREDVEKGSLDDGVDEARGIAPERNTCSQVQWYVFNNTREEDTIIQVRESDEDEGLRETDEERGAPDENQEGDHSLLLVDKGRQGLADGYKLIFLRRNNYGLTQIFHIQKSFANFGYYRINL